METNEQNRPKPQWDKVEVAYDLEEDKWELSVPDKMAFVSIHEANFIKAQLAKINSHDFMLAACKSLMAQVTSNNRILYPDGESFCVTRNCAAAFELIRAAVGQATPKPAEVKP